MAQQREEREEQQQKQLNTVAAAAAEQHWAGDEPAAPIAANGVCGGNNNGQEQEHDARDRERGEEEEQQKEQLNGSSLNSLAIDSFTLIALITPIPVYTHSLTHTHTQAGLHAVSIKLSGNGPVYRCCRRLCCCAACKSIKLHCWLLYLSSVSVSLHVCVRVYV